MPTFQTAPAEGSVITTAVARLLAVLRVAVGFVFLRAFLDKTFGLRDPSAKVWIHGGSQTEGFLSAVEVGPFESTFHSWAGTSGQLAAHAGATQAVGA
jgi:thiosulfate dehydrogenase [quinone] large subunit